MKNQVLVFCDFSWPRGHENWWKTECLIFVIFHDLGVIKIDEKPCACFLWFFMTPGVMKIDEKRKTLFLWFLVNPGSWKLMKNGKPFFCVFSWPRVHENWWKMESLIFVIFCDRGVIKIDEKPSACFLWFFMTLGSWKLMKNGKPYFCDFLWPRGHKNRWKTKCLFFVIFHDPGFMKIDEKRTTWFLWIFMTPGSWKLMKNRVSDFCDFSWLQGHENWWKPSAWFFWIFMTAG